MKTRNWIEAAIARAEQIEAECRATRAACEADALEFERRPLTSDERDSLETVQALLDDAIWGAVR